MIKNNRPLQTKWQKHQYIILKKVVTTMTVIKHPVVGDISCHQDRDKIPRLQAVDAEKRADDSGAMAGKTTGSPKKHGLAWRF